MIFRTVTLAMIILLLQGCGMTMPRYEPDYDNVQTLRAKEPLAKLDLPNVNAAAGQNSVMVRANPIHSPEGSLSKHMQKALEGELRLAGLLQPGADRHLDVTLRQTSLDAAVFGQGKGTLSAEFNLRKNDQSLYSATKTVNSSWDSSFVGALAIPRAANAFNPLVTRLLAELYQDPAFIRALQQ